MRDMVSQPPGALGYGPRGMLHGHRPIRRRSWTPACDSIPSLTVSIVTAGYFTCKVEKQTVEAGALFLYN